MNLINKQNINVFFSFIECYETSLNETLNSEVSIIILPFQDENPHNDPLMCYANIIEYSEEVCERLDLSEDEVHAMIAHEIGHIIDKTNLKDGTISREVYADNVAKVLGLGNALISGLSKLIESGLYPAQNDINNERIKILESE